MKRKYNETFKGYILVFSLMPLALKLIVYLAVYYGEMHFYLFTEIVFYVIEMYLNVENYNYLIENNKTKKNIFKLIFPLSIMVVLIIITCIQIYFMYFR